MFDMTYCWIALLITMEGGAAAGLGYCDYLTKKSKPDVKIWMRKKKLAFTKLSILFTSYGLYLLNTPTPH